MADLSVKVCGVEFNNPLIAASGTFGFGMEYSELYPLEKLGGISCKGITLTRRDGNPVPRVAETPSGILNAVGLQNPGVDVFINEDLPWLKKQNTVIIANIAGNTPEDYCAMAEKLSETDVDMIELNISCPNVKSGGVQFGTSCESVGAITAAVKKYCKKPLIVKLSPNVTDIASIAQSAEANGADAISMINTLTGMRIDINSRRPIIRNNTGGMSGPAIFPVAVRMVWQVANAVKIPIIGMGGITTAEDAMEFILAGATAVSIGTANFSNPMATVECVRGIEAYMKRHQVEDINDLIGIVKYGQHQVLNRAAHNILHRFLTSRFSSVVNLCSSNVA